MDFDYGAVNNWWSGVWGNYDIGKGMADQVVDELVNDGSFRVIERKKLDTVLAEQDFAQSDRADPSAAKLAKVGKVLGVPLHHRGLDHEVRDVRQEVRRRRTRRRQARRSRAEEGQERGDRDRAHDRRHDGRDHAVGEGRGHLQQGRRRLRRRLRRWWRRRLLDGLG
jgi:hypothetical protein